jgi:uncharacterized membrane protein YidH (DUF202 family)
MKRRDRVLLWVLCVLLVVNGLRRWKRGVMKLRRRSEGRSSRILRVHAVSLISVLHAATGRDGGPS